MAKPDPLKLYKSKRNFAITPEPQDGGRAGLAQRAFVIQKHWASSLHYDFRLEVDGAMKSWAVPKGPCYDPGVKRMAVQVEDHPISYNTFEGQIPAGQYGAGRVIIWDRGHWEPLGDAAAGLKKGELKFVLHGQKLQGRWVLVRMKGKGEKQTPWLLIKERDAYARPLAEYDVVEALPDSVKAGAETSPAKKPGADSSAAEPANAPAGVASAGAAASDTPTDGPPPGARKAALPTQLAPELATLVDAPPTDDGWQYEIKFDGYRIVTRIENGEVKLFTRNGNDWSARLKHLQPALLQLGLGSAWLDGEIVVLNKDGHPDFQALQNAFENSATTSIVYQLFDLPHCEGYDLTAVELRHRRAVLQRIVERRPAAGLQMSESFDQPPAALVASACAIGLEGIIGKRSASPYVSRRSSDWIKLKCGRRQEFVVGGYTDPQGARSGFGALLLGVYGKDGALEYAGNVGSGFSEKSLAALKRQFDALAAGASPFAEATGEERRAHWLRPELVAEISFTGWTSSNHLRHPVFEGLRADKEAASVIRETAKKTSAKSAPNADAKTARATKGGGSKHSGKSGDHTALLAGLKITHPGRVIDTTTGIDKLALLRFYALVAPLMLPHLKGRPVSLVRAPDGISGGLFFQKHMEAGALPGIHLLPQALDPGHAPLMEVVKAEGLLAAGQMNVIEFHTWNAQKDHIDKPDRMTFDLDPGEGVAWAEMQEAATVVRVFLDQLGLRCWLKTSGGKGLHVVVPLKRQYGWDAVKDFSQAIVVHLAQTLPTRFAAKSGPKNRIGKIFVDYLRNGFGATTACAWSARARPGMGVSVPLGWDELEQLTASDQWNVANIEDRLAVGNGPWDDYQSAPQRLAPAMKMLGFKPV